MVQLRTRERIRKEREERIRERERENESNWDTSDVEWNDHQNVSSCSIFLLIQFSWIELEDYVVEMNGKS